MEIIKPINKTSSPLTLEEKKQNFVQEVTNLLSAGYQSLVINNNKVRDLFYNNPNGLTVQQCFDAFGTDMANIFTIGSLAATFINAIHPNTVATSAPVEVIINSDGTAVDVTNGGVSNPI